MSATTTTAPFSTVTAAKRILGASSVFCFGWFAGLYTAVLIEHAALAQILTAPVTAAGTNANPLLMLLALIPQPYAGYAVSAFSIATTVITAASLICAAFPAPTTTSGVWYAVYTVINKLAVNVNHAKSLSAPESAGIVGGPGSISAPLVATAVVPLATATPAQKAVTVVPAVLPTPATAPTVPAADVVAGNQAAAAFEAKKAAAVPPPLNPTGATS